MRAYVGLGSNLGDREGYLERAVDSLRELDPGAVCSPVYETEPVGGPVGQGPYLNCVVRVDSHLSPHELLDLAHQLEAAAGRVRDERWGARTLDVDLLIVEGVEIDDEDLTLPHPRLHERAFVLAPLEDLAPQLVPPAWRERLGGVEAVDAMVRLARADGR